MGSLLTTDRWMLLKRLSLELEFQTEKVFFYEKKNADCLRITNFALLIYGIFLIFYAALSEIFSATRLERADWQSNQWRCLFSAPRSIISQSATEFAASRLNLCCGLSPCQTYQTCTKKGNMCISPSVGDTRINVSLRTF